jgi:hypothetical protein
MSSSRLNRAQRKRGQLAPQALRCTLLRRHTLDEANQDHEDCTDAHDDRLIDVRYWHLADIDADDDHVCFWGQSGHA